ncbi:glycoside hydrolase family 73 protein [Carnobacterium sp.]|uniref:glycoside hydrolase family 73 protein n=1 Tax=Carnobacterium sp. TaxID=48221 RepID=UPI00388D0EE4
MKNKRFFTISLLALIGLIFTFEGSSTVFAETTDNNKAVLENDYIGPGYYDETVNTNKFKTDQSRSASTSNFLDTIKSGAISGWKKYQILPSVTAAQAILESDWGRSGLATTGNNLFGIKGRYNGQYVLYPTKEYINGNWVTVNAEFRKYPNWATSVENHGEFFHQNSRYSNLIGVTDYKKVANLLQQDGYATDPAYPSKLINLVEANGLQSWDEEAFSGGVPNNLADNDIIRIKPTASKWSKKTQTKDAPFDTVDKSVRFKVLQRSGVLLNIQTLDESYGGWIYDWDANLVSKTSTKAGQVIKFTDTASAWSKRIQEKNAPVSAEDKGKYFEVLQRSEYMLNIQAVDGSFGGWIYDWDARVIAPTAAKVNDKVVFKTSAKRWYKRTDTFEASVDTKDRGTTFVVLRRDGNKLNIQATDKSYGGWVYDWDMDIK